MPEPIDTERFVFSSDKYQQLQGLIERNGEGDFPSLATDNPARANMYLRYMAIAHTDPILVEDDGTIYGFSEFDTIAHGYADQGSTQETVSDAVEDSAVLEGWGNTEAWTGDGEDWVDAEIVPNDPVEVTVTVLGVDAMRNWISKNTRHSEAETPVDVATFRLDD